MEPGTIVPDICSSFPEHNLFDLVKNCVPDALTLAKISQKCGVSTDWLLGQAWGVKSIDSDVVAVGEYTGLCASATTFLRSVHDKPEYTEVIGALLSNTVFPSFPDYVLEMRHAALESEFERQSEAIPDGRIIRGYEHEIFLEYCADCGAKLYHCRTASWTHEQECYTCATYRGKKGCSAHYIRAVVLERLVLQNLQRVVAYAQEDEDEFVRRVMEAC